MLCRLLGLHEYVKPGGERMHRERFDPELVPDGVSQDQEVERLVSLGARIIDDRRHATPGGWVVMADPEGNEFDLEGGG